MLLLDNNISPRLCKKLEAHFPGTVHVEDIGLDDSPDVVVWDYAINNGLTVVSKDSDFNNILHLKGYPPKVIWLRCGNVTTSFWKNYWLIGYWKSLNSLRAPRQGFWKFISCTDVRPPTYRRNLFVISGRNFYF
ncbi:MAG: DUF5615 family PIN-like protein [Saprospirales bacterium]|nr:DUF5615 family PIN-like protein [Saprospirales bacterium]